MNQLTNPFNRYMESMDVVPFALCCSRLTDYTDDELEAIEEEVRAQSELALKAESLSPATIEQKQITIDLLRQVTSNFIGILKAVPLENRQKAANAIIPPKLVTFCGHLTHMCGVINWFIHSVYNHAQEDWYEYGQMAAVQCEYFDTKTLTDFLEMMKKASDAVLNVKQLPKEAQKAVGFTILQKNLDHMHHVVCEHEREAVELFHKIKAKISSNNEGELADEIDPRLLTDISGANTIH